MNFTKNSDSPKTNPCPTCRKTTVFSEENPYRPFCSERCQLLDLGQWADEKYGVPGEPVSPEELAHHGHKTELDEE